MGRIKTKEAKRNALLAHKRRMAEHGRKKINITSSTVEEAMNIPAQKPRAAKITKPLTHRIEVVAVSASVAENAKRGVVKRAKFPRSMQLKKSKQAKRLPDIREISPSISLQAQTSQKMPKEHAVHRPSPSDEQPRFEGGFRILQAGLVEQRKRR